MPRTIKRTLMNIDRVISKIRNLKETPTNNISGGDIGTYDKFLFPPSEDLLSQDYDISYAFSTTQALQKLDDEGRGRTTEQEESYEASAKVTAVAENTPALVFI